ncbi:ABC transporter substrate-binding protein [Halovulum sp. GXIMD14794]
MGPAIFASARLDAKLITITIMDQTAIVVQPDCYIATVADLKGKTTAYPGKGSQQYPLLIKALADAGLNEDDGHFAPMANENFGAKRRCMRDRTVSF